MAKTPTPRSYQQILGGMINTFLFRTGLKGMRPGSPILSVLETAATSDTRATQAFFSMLDDRDLERATGEALERIGYEEGVPKEGASPATGYVDFTDTTFTKISTVIYSGTPAPIAGSTSIVVADASQFPVTGRIYIGRGTSNYEGPLRYTNVQREGSYWRITLESPTTKFHNIHESVILARGGDRPIRSGTIVETADGSARYEVVYGTVLRDGETSVQNVYVAALTPGIVGNVPVGAVNTLRSPPFPGATVTNRLPFTNGREPESDDAYRARIRRARQTRARGTALAIKHHALGVQAPHDEASRVVSASVVSFKDEPTVVYIDDGTGYEESAQGIPFEVLIDSAFGGEDRFELPHRPIAKAFAKTSVEGPWNLPPGAALCVRTNGVIYTHVFSPSDFRSMSQATAYECVASINGNPSLGFAARTADGQTRFSIFSKKETGEEIEVLPYTGPGFDANKVFGFPNARVDSIRLYLNDRMLRKDGVVPSITSAPISTWGLVSEGETLTINVDGTGFFTYTFTGEDFAKANTGYSAVSRTNSIEAWAAVFNRKIPGVITVAEGDRLVLRSARGASKDASLEIDAAQSSLVGMGVFSPEALVSYGQASDYTFDRNTGQGRLASPLKKGDRLTAGTSATTAFVESERIPGGTVTFTGEARISVSVDGSEPVEIQIPGTEFATPDTPREFSLEEITEALNSSSALPGGYFSVSGNEYFRIHTNTANKGSIEVTSVNPQGARLGLPVGEKVAVDTSHLAYVETQNSDHDYEAFGNAREGFTLGPADDLFISLGEGRTHNVPLYRNIASEGSEYSISFPVRDLDGNGKLSDAFGEEFDWRGFAVYMRSRGVSHADDPTREALWRFGRFGAEGDAVEVAYDIPRAPSSPFQISIENRGETSLVRIHLPSTEETPGILLEDTARVTLSAGDGEVTLQVSEPSIVALQRKLISSQKKVEAECGEPHGLVVGDLVYLELDAVLTNYPNGWKKVTEVVSPTVFRYNEAGLVDEDPVEVSGVIRFTREPTNLAAVQPGDILAITGTDPLSMVFGGVYQVASATANSVTVFSDRVDLPTEPIKIGKRSNLQFYKIDTTQTSVASIVDWVNNNSDIIEGFTPDGSGIISSASDPVRLAGGLNYVESLAADSLTLRDPQPIIGPAYDFSEESIRLVPTTAKNVADFLAAPAVSGVSSTARISTSSQGSRVQALALETGSKGYVQVSGGTANTSTANVVGSARKINDYTIVSIPFEQGDGFTGGMWVSLENGRLNSKLTAQATEEVSVTDGVVRFKNATLWNRLWTNNAEEEIEVRKVGRFASIRFLNEQQTTKDTIASFSQGDWLHISSGNLPAANNGWLRIVRTEDWIIWVDHAGAYDATSVVGIGELAVYSSDSVLPGDSLLVNSDVLGAANRGVWKINALGSTNKQIIVEGLTNHPNTVLGNLASSVKVTEGTPLRLFKQIVTINRNGSNPALLDVSLASASKAEVLGEVYGTVLTAQCKLNFDNQLHQGIDAYARCTGLIGEVSRVLYGDERNPSVYPGVIAAGTNVNIQSPLVKRIRLALAVRKGDPDRIRGAVAAVVNQHGVGESIALSDIVEAANAYCEAVTVTYPTYSIGRDVIPVQAYEKPMIIAPETDIAISILGD